MSRATKLTIDFLNGIKTLIRLSATNGDTTCSLKQGYHGRPVRTIKALPREGLETISCPEDIECVVPWSQLQHLYVHPDADSGELQYLEVDSQLVKSMYPSSETIRVIAVIPRSELKCSLFEGHHYFVSVQGDTKTHQLYTDDQKVLSVLYHGLVAQNQVVIGKYVSANHEKCCAIYPEDGGLVMSVLNPSNFLRTRDQDHILNDLDQSARLGSSLVKHKVQDHWNSDWSRDTFDDRLLDHIQRVVTECQSGGTKMRLKINVLPPPPQLGEGVGILDHIANL